MSVNSLIWFLITSLTAEQEGDHKIHKPVYQECATETGLGTKILESMWPPKGETKARVSIITAFSQLTGPEQIVNKDEFHTTHYTILLFIDCHPF